MAIGDFHMLLPDDPVLYAFTRTLGEVRLLVLGNFSSSPVPVDLSGDPADDGGWATAELVLGNYADWSWGTLRPWEAVVMRRVG